jgi:hypothetical protein
VTTTDAARVIGCAVGFPCSISGSGVSTSISVRPQNGFGHFALPGVRDSFRDIDSSVGWPEFVRSRVYGQWLLHQPWPGLDW